MAPDTPSTSPPDAPSPATPPDPATCHDPAKLFDLILDPRQRGELYPYLNRLREIAPLHRSSALHGRPAWLISSLSSVDWPMPTCSLLES